jgi:hypothetical protein
MANGRHNGDTCAMSKISGWTATVAAALVLATSSTVADLVWAWWIPSHRAAFGLIHGALLFMLLGVVLGVLAARARRDGKAAATVTRAAAGELFAGLSGAAAFYALFSAIGWAAMFVAWMWVWMITAFVYRWVRGSEAGLEATLARGGAAAVLSGIAFWAISGIWLGGSTRNPDYAVNFVSWFVAFAPGFACLLLEPASRGASTSPAEE